jgi:hypothetical protein
MHLATLSRVLHETLTISELVKKFPAFYGTPMFITVVTTARHLSLSWARSIRYSPSHSLYLRCTVILTWHLTPIYSRWTLPPQVSVIHPTCNMRRPSHPPWFEHLSNMWWGIYSWNSLYILLQLPCYVINMFSQALLLCSSCNMRNQVSPTYETTGKITPHSPYILLPVIRCNSFFFHLLSKNIIIIIYVTIILFAGLCGCETCFLTLKEEHRLRVFENWVLRKMFGPKRDEVRGEWRRLLDKEPYCL